MNTVPVRLSIEFKEKFHRFSFEEPINIVHGMFKTDNEPIRLSYHCGVHYNSIVDPWRPTAGHGLGLPDLQPGV